MKATTKKVERLDEETVIKINSSGVYALRHILSYCDELALAIDRLSDRHNEIVAKLRQIERVVSK